MNQIKVNDFCNAYAKALGLNNETKLVLIELMCNIITKYESIIPPIPVSVEKSSNSLFIKPTNGTYPIEDFFLNKLMRNIWEVQAVDQHMIDEGFADSHLKGAFLPDQHTVIFNYAKLDGQLAPYEKLFLAQSQRFENIKQNAKKKVAMHEFEHGLQTRYDNTLDQRFRSAYKKIYDEISKMPQYKFILRTYEEIPKQLGDIERYLSTGTHIGSVVNEQNGRTYRNINGFDNLNEILNESESLEMARQEIYLRKPIGNSGNSYPLRNPESSNCLIANYGDLLKIVFGGKESFELMYIDPIGSFQKFNSLYNDVFQQVYGSSKDAIELFINAITEIKEKGAEIEHLKLCEVLSKCLQKRINAFYNDKNVSNDQMMYAIKMFEKYSISNNDKDKNSQLEHIKVLESLKQKVSIRNMPTIQVSHATEEKKENNLISIPTFEEIKHYSQQYALIYDTDNSIKIINKYTKEIVSDKNIEEIAIFSNIWLTAAGVKRNNDNGESYAFNDGAKDTYNFLINAINYSINRTGNLNSIELFKNAENLDYKYSQEIITRLFISEYQANFIDNFFRKRIITNMRQTEMPTALINMFYASDLAYGNEQLSQDDRKTK